MQLHFKEKDLVDWKGTPQEYENSLLYSQYLYNQDVYIIGLPYPEIDIPNDGVIVGVNHNLLKIPKADIIYHQSSAEPTKLLSSPKTKLLKFMCINYCQTYKEHLASYCLENRITPRLVVHSAWPTKNLIAPEYEPLCLFQKNLGCMPLTGILAIADLLMQPIKSLNIIGFDFYFVYGIGVRKQIGPHFIPPQLNWLWSVCGKDYRVKWDNKLQRVFDFYGERGNEGKFYE